jgi:hypothetical protein
LERANHLMKCAGACHDVCKIQLNSCSVHFISESILVFVEKEIWANRESIASFV